MSYSASTGKHMICDIKHIQNTALLGSREQLEQMMTEICEKHRYTILHKTSHEFQPHGITILYMLSESHFSIHTFPEHNYAAIDLYTCKSYESNDEYNTIALYLSERFGSSQDTIRIVDRMS